MLRNWRKRRKSWKLFEIPSSQGDVRIELADGSVCVWETDAQSEQWCDGWATVDDIAQTLVERVHLAPGEALFVASEVVRQWEEWMAGQPHRYPQRSN